MKEPARRVERESDFLQTPRILLSSDAEGFMCAQHVHIYDSFGLISYRARPGRWLCSPRYDETQSGTDLPPLTDREGKASSLRDFWTMRVKKPHQPVVAPITDRLPQSDVEALQ